MTQPYLFPSDGRLWLYEKPEPIHYIVAHGWYPEMCEAAKANALEVENPHAMLEVRFKFTGSKSIVCWRGEDWLDGEQPLPANLTYEVVEQFKAAGKWRDASKWPSNYAPQEERKVYRLKEKEVEPVKLLDNHRQALNLLQEKIDRPENQGINSYLKQCWNDLSEAINDIDELRAENARLSEVNKKMASVLHTSKIVFTKLIQDSGLKRVVYTAEGFSQMHSAISEIDIVLSEQK